jgi:hypothetical protein
MSVWWSLLADAGIDRRMKNPPPEGAGGLSSAQPPASISSAHQGHREAEPTQSADPPGRNGRCLLSIVAFAVRVPFCAPPRFFMLSRSSRGIAEGGDSRCDHRAASGDGGAGGAGSRGRPMGVVPSTGPGTGATFWRCDHHRRTLIDGDRTGAISATL